MKVKVTPTTDIKVFDDNIVKNRFIDPLRLAAFYLEKNDNVNKIYNATIFTNSTA